MQGVEHGYRYREWCVVYSDKCGCVQVIYFDTIEQAQKFFDNGFIDPYCRIGIMTTAFWQNGVKEDLK